tara:strand:- start:17 stop:295 length:279 start_codon:yes stop_codon:yes gene_type:complete
MTQYVNPKLIQFALSKIRKSSNFNYQRAIARNKKGTFKLPPLQSLLDFLNARKFSEEEKGNIVSEFWERVAENPKFEKEIAQKFKIKYNRKV